MSIMIYAILSVKKNPGKLDPLLAGIKGISGAGLYAVLVDKVAVAVCDINKVDLVADKSGAIEYASVIETLAQQYTLLPVRYGSVMESAGTIKKLLKRNYVEIQQNLKKVENKFEFGLKVFCDSEKLIAELKAESKETNEVEQKSGSEIQNSVFREYINKKLKEHRREEMMLSYVDSVIAELTEFLTHLNTVNKIKKMASPKNIIDAVFLLKKDKIEEMVQAIKDFQSKYPELNFILTGPWPPYNFVEFTIK